MVLVRGAISYMLGTFRFIGRNTMVEPNLFIVGSAKSGSSALHSYLSEHPDIIGSSPKEPSYFIDSDELKRWWPAMAKDPVSYDLNKYMESFQVPVGADPKYYLDSSVGYSQYPRYSGVPERIKKFNGSARIIFIVKNPINRTISHYWQERAMLHETRSFEDAIREEPLYHSSSDYELQLKPYLELFDKVKIVDSEELLKNRIVTLNAIIQWLELPEIDYNACSLDDKHVSKGWSRKARNSTVVTMRNTAAWQLVRSKLSEKYLDKIRNILTTDVEKEDLLADVSVTTYLKDYYYEGVGRFDSLVDGKFQDKWFG